MEGGPMRWLVFLATLAACSTYAPVMDPSLDVSAEFTPAQREAIAKAAAKWNTITMRPIVLKGGGHWRVFLGSPKEVVADGYVGWTISGSRHEIWIKPGLSEETFYATILHELGHALGLHHVQGKAVMNPTVGQTEFTEADLEECRNAFACDLSEEDKAKLRHLGVIE